MQAMYYVGPAYDSHTERSYHVAMEVKIIEGRVCEMDQRLILEYGQQRETYRVCGTQPTIPTSSPLPVGSALPKVCPSSPTGGREPILHHLQDLPAAEQL